MFLDEVARVFLEKLWPRQLDRQIADGYFRESTVWFVGRDAIRDEKICVVPVIICGDPMLKSAVT